MSPCEIARMEDDTRRRQPVAAKARAAVSTLGPASSRSLPARLEVTQERLRQVTADHAALRTQLEHALDIIRAERQGLRQKA